jgi:hypothetical protein
MTRSYGLITIFLRANDPFLRVPDTFPTAREPPSQEDFTPSREVKKDTSLPSHLVDFLPNPKSFLLGTVLTWF